MKTLESLVDFKSNCLDGRDFIRLAAFIPEVDFPKFGITTKPEFAGTHVHKEWTRENILEQLRADVSFGFEKALNKRGISSGLMYAVVQMWNKILEEGLENFDDYPQYGLPLFKATADKYGFDNPIGEDEGSEEHYSEMDDY